MNEIIDISRIALKTERMILRQIKKNELENYCSHFSIDSVGNRAYCTSDTLALEYKGKIIGLVSLGEYNEEAYPELANIKGRELSFVLSKDHWGQDFMFEAVQQVKKYLFDVGKLDFILTRNHKWDKQTAEVIEKCGFKYIKMHERKSLDGKDETITESIVYRPHFMEGYVYENDTELVQELYRRMDESTRLTKSKAAQVEFITNTRYIEKYLKEDSKILDIGAGTGEYSLYFAKKGYKVSALELSDSNIRAFRQKLTASEKIDLTEGNALDLRKYESDHFDVVIVFGPLYHLHSEEDQLKCIKEAKRVCKPDGKIFFAFLSNDMVVLTMFNEHPDYFVNGAYDKESFKLTDFPFVFHTVDACRRLLDLSGLKIIHEVASDGLSELMKDKINAMDEKSYKQYLRYHAYSCEKREHLELSNHLLFVCE